MTVVVWDGNFLAADKQANSNGIKIPVTKIGKLELENKKYLYGYSGITVICLELLDWIKKGSNVNKFPQAVRDAKGDSTLLLISEDKRIFLFEGGPIPTEFTEAKRFAIGSGRDIAYGVMEIDADSYTAVKIASKIETGCGSGIDMLSFD